MPLRHSLTVHAGFAVFLALNGGTEPASGKDRNLQRFAAEFVELTPGKSPFPASFLMGRADGAASHWPALRVTFAKPFAVARFETTQELYAAVVGKNPSLWKGPRNSVEQVSWDEANEFCRLATVEMQKRRLLGLDEIIRLPSEAEWEYACRAGTQTRYSFGDDAGAFDDYGWHNGNAKGNDPPVGAKRPNSWGLYDMHGYVWEWCADAWSPTLADVSAAGAPRIADNAKERVLRGGSWADGADRAQSSYRHRQPPDTRSDAIGFRCVRAKLPK